MKTCHSEQKARHSELVSESVNKKTNNFDRPRNEFGVTDGLRHSERSEESKILIFGGTSEGRELAEILAKNKIECELHVATEYGGQVVENSDLPQDALSLIHIKTGRLSKEEMRALAETGNYKVVVDATHPFATEVSENIRESFCDKTIIRLERNLNHIEEKNLFYFDDASECEKLLVKFAEKNPDARIFLTTGSKDLHIFCRNETLRKNLVARVLPSVESLKICEENKLEGKQIIAMQGPFSQKMNEAQIRDYKIQILVTKESGRAGGVDEKIEAAKTCGIKCFVIKAARKKQTLKQVQGDNDCPQVHVDTHHCELENRHTELVSASVEKVGNYITTSSVHETCERLSKILSKKILSTAKLKISLCGIGMGNPKNLTREVEDAIQNAELVFGARRMIENLETSAKRFPFYLAKDIIPELEKAQSENFDEVKVVVLFSGDTGFFSGAAKLYAELKKLENAEVKIFPGISSMSYLAAKSGISYENTKIISTHGVDEKIWKPELQTLLEKIADKNSVFFITSGAEDVQKIGKIVYSVENNRQIHNVFKIILGFNLSYQDEKILELTAEECEKINEKGLYCGFISHG